MNLSELSNEELLALRSQAAENPLAGLSDEQLLAMRAQAQPQQASGGGGNPAAQLGYGLIEGAASIPGALGDVAGLMDKGIDWVADKFGARPRGERPRPLMPNTQEILQTIKPVTGEMPAPQSAAGGYLRTIGQFAPGLAAPGGPVRRVVGGVLAPAVASEAAGQAAREVAPDYETAARVVSGIGGGVAGAIRLPRVGANARAERALTEAVTPEVADELAKLGPEAFLFEGSPQLMQTAQGVVQRPGPSSNALRTAVTERHRATPDRLQEDVRATLGPPIDPNRVDARIGRAQAKLSPDYRAAMESAAPTNSAAILNVIDQDIGKLAGNPQKALQEIRGFFFNGNRLKNSAGELLSIRAAIDDMVPRYEGQANATRVITETRQAVDDAIRQASPDIKAVDARFASLAKQREALEAGGQILATGKEAMRPSELRRQLTDMTPNQRAALRIGARAEIDRVLGNSVYDVNAIRGLIKTEGKWAHEKLALAFDPDTADELIRLVDREAAFRRAYDRLIANSQTASRLIAEEATRVNNPANIAPQALGAMAGMAVSGGNVMGAIPGAMAGSAVRNVWERAAAGGQRRLDAALVDRLGAQGTERDALVTALMNRQAQQNARTPFSREALVRALLAIQGGTVPARAGATQ